MGPIRAALVGWLSVAADADSDPPREYRPQPRGPLPLSPNSAYTRITLCSKLITLPGPVTVTARSALALLDWLLDHHAQLLSRLQTSKATLEASPACLD